MKSKKRILLYFSVFIIYLICMYIGNTVAKESGDRRLGLRTMTISVLIIHMSMSFLLLKKNIFIRFFSGFVIALFTIWLTPIFAIPPSDYHENTLVSALRMVVSGAIISILVWEIIYLISTKKVRE